VFDIALLRPVPNLLIMQPKDEQELADMLFTALNANRPAVIRYPRGGGHGAQVRNEFRSIPEGQAEVLRDGTDVQIWALGDMIPVAMDASVRLQAAGIAAGVVNARFAAPLDSGLLLRHGGSARVVATIENGVERGGFGSGVQELLAGAGSPARVMRFGWPHEFIGQGKPDALMRKHGLDGDSVAAAIMALVR
jgi:1-deoxy-D-xylulose-5-phosphate synthase